MSKWKGLSSSLVPGSIDLVGREAKRPRWGERRKAPSLLYINSKYSPDILWRTRHSPNSSDEVIFCYIMLLLSHGHFMQEIFIFKVHMSDQICVCFSNVNPLCSSFSFISLWSLLNPVRSNWSKEFNSPNIGGCYLLFIEYWWYDRTFPAKDELYPSSKFPDLFFCFAVKFRFL